MCWGAVESNWVWPLPIAGWATLTAASVVHQLRAVIKAVTHITVHGDAGGRPCLPAAKQPLVLMQNGMKVQTSLCIVASAHTNAHRHGPPYMHPQEVLWDRSQGGPVGLLESEGLPPHLLLAGRFQHTCPIWLCAVLSVCRIACMQRMSARLLSYSQAAHACD